VRTYTIGEAAARSGFPASTLRYYEGIGLVEPSDRTEAGYRVYDERALARLLFVARAKQLGCSLEEITELVAAWDGERCGPVQHRLHDLVTDKIAAVQHKTVELLAFGAQLQSAAAQLATEPVDGPCGEGCACVAEAAVEPTPVVLGHRADASVPIACTLEGGMTSEPAGLSTVGCGSSSRPVFLSRRWPA
jgi:DNA-binding transcriptional MerR regulator